MSQAKNILKNTTALATAQIVQRASTACLSFLVARYLGAAALGIYTAAIVIFNIVILAARMGAETYLVREISRNKSRTSFYIVHVAVITTIAALGVGICARLIVPQLGYSSELTACVYVVILAVVPGSLNTVLTAAFVAHQRTQFVAYSTFIAATTNLIVSVVLLNNGRTILALVTTYTLLQYCLALLSFVFLRLCVCRLQWIFNFRSAWSILKELKAFAGNSILGGMCARPEIIILSLFRNDAQIGFYSAAFRLVDVWSLLPQSYVTNVFPVLSRLHNERNQQRFKFVVGRSVKYLLTFSLPLATGLFIAARPIVELLYGQGFEPAVQALRVLAWSLPLAAIFELLWPVLMARDEQHLVLRSQVMATFGKFVGGYALIASFAALGAAISVPLMLLMQNMLLAFYVRRGGTPLRLARHGARPVLAVATMSIITVLLMGHTPLVVLIAAAAVVYAISVVFLGVFVRDERAWLRVYLRQRLKPDQPSAPAET